MDSKELRAAIKGKLLEKRVEVEDIKMRVTALVKEVQSDLKEAGQELETLEVLAELVVDEVDEITSTGIAEPVDAPIMKAMLKKLLKTPAGVKLEAAFQAIRAKLD